MKAELLCFRECLRFCTRHPRYVLILMGLYAASLRRWRRLRPARLGYAFLQLFDDLMDGDRRSAETPDDVATRTMMEWKCGTFSGRDPLSRLGRAFHHSIQHHPRAPEDDPERDTAILLQRMHEDARRRQERRISADAELAPHLRQTFFCSVNLLLQACGHKVRAAEMPALISALAWCSVVRDFAEDAGKGLINVPREVLGDGPDHGDLVSRPEVRAWLAAQRALGPELLEACESERKTVALKDPPAARLAGRFVRSMYKYCSFA